ncbi:MAG TPA: anti-sigma factor [Thermoanaerobaculia bacterium]
MKKPPVDPCAPHGLSCEKLILEYLAEYTDGTMSPVDRIEMERHLTACPPCGVYLESYRVTGVAIRSIKPREIPPDLARAVIAFVRARRDKKP